MAEEGSVTDLLQRALAIKDRGSDLIRLVRIGNLVDAAMMAREIRLLVDELMPMLEERISRGLIQDAMGEPPAPLD